MADTTATTTRKRAPVKRLTAAERRDKAIASIDGELAKAGVALVHAAEGYVAAGQRPMARKCLDAWDTVLSIAEPPAGDGEPGATT